MVEPSYSRPAHLSFDAQVAAIQDAIAATSDAESVTYAQLSRLANRIARRLLHAGVRSGDRVGVCADPSIRRIAALVGILKSGGIYVALDPTHPAERAAFMLRDAGAVAVLTDLHGATRLAQS